MPGPVLLVDDDQDLREIITHILTLHDYPVLTARNGREAVRLLSRCEPPCVILLDLMMPVMDGWEFRAWQLGEPRFSKVPVVVLSAVQGELLRRQELCDAEFIPKPVEIDQIVEVVRRNCGAGTGGCA